MGILRQTTAAVRALLTLTLLLGIIYPLVMTGAARAFAHQADGSLIRSQGRVIGSSLIGQDFHGAQWFASRPSASNYDGTSSATNFGQNNPEQKSDVAKRRAELVKNNPDARGPVPADALTASASGLDPDISVAYANWQAPRIAKARSLEASTVAKLVKEHTAGAGLGFLGQQRVNVLELNLALAKLTNQK